MNVFVLTTGKSGSVTFARACSHIINYTSGHETRARKWKDRFHYPDNHIEVDPRLAWWLGTLDKLWGDEARYVWLRRDPEAVARSTARKKHWEPSAINHWPYVAYLRPTLSPESAAHHMVTQVEHNIEMFLKDKSHWFEFWIDDKEEKQYSDFWKFWNGILAEGDFENAVAEFRVKHNATSHRG